MSSEPTKISIEDRIKSLLQDEATVLYWKCRDYKYWQIAEKVQWGEAWVQLRMVRVYKKLGFNKNMHWSRRVRLLRQKYCPVFNELIQNEIGNIPKIFAPEVEFIEDIEVIEEENQERWIVKSRRDEEDEIIEGEVTAADMEILDLVLYDEMKDTEDSSPPGLPAPRGAIDAEEVDSEEYERRIRGEERRQRRSADTGQGGPPPRGTGTSTARRNPNWGWIFLGVATFLLILWVAGNNIPSSTPTPTTSTIRTLPPTPRVSTRTPTPNVSPTPSYTSTPEITPTPLALPIREDFNVEYSELWTTIGNPFLTISQDTWLGYDGVLITREAESGAIAIGNVGWTDYIVYLRADQWTGHGRATFQLSVRMKDMDNRIILKCDGTGCDWIVVYEGRHDVLEEDHTFYLYGQFVMTVQGNRFTAVGNDTVKDWNMQLILPQEYQDKFPGGGVMVEILDYEVDYIEIQPFR